MAATAGVGCQVDLTVWGQLCALSRVPQSPLSAPVPPLPLMSAAGQSSMSPSPAASMIGPLMRPNVMTVFAMVFTMPMVSVLQRGDAAAHRARDVRFKLGWLIFTCERLICAPPCERSYTPTSFLNKTRD